MRPRLSIKAGPAGWEETDLGTMETQSSSPTWRRWSLALLLLGLVMPPATAQALTYREAVLRAVDGFNQQSSEANLYRLLELDPLPEAVSWGSGLGGTTGCHQGRPYSHLLGSCWTSCRKGTSSFKWDPPLPGFLPRAVYPPITTACCLRVSTLWRSDPYTSVQTSGTSGSCRDKNGVIGPGM